MEAQGILTKKMNERSGISQSGNEWHFADYLLEIPGMYPRHINFSVSDGQSARFAQFDAMIGKEVIVYFDIDANERDGRWYNTIRAFGIKAIKPEAEVKP